MWGLDFNGLRVLTEQEIDPIVSTGAFVECAAKEWNMMELFELAFPGKTRSEIRKAAKGNALRFGPDKVSLSELFDVEKINPNHVQFVILGWGKRSREFVVFTRTL